MTDAEPLGPTQPPEHAEAMPDAELVAEAVRAQQDARGRFVAGNTIGAQWQPGGPSPNPGGRPKDAVSLTVEAKKILAEIGSDGRTNAALLAQKLLDLALAGNVECMRYLGDRTDGKPAQAVTLSLDEGPLHYRLAVRDGGPRLSAAPPDDAS